MNVDKDTLSELMDQVHGNSVERKRAIAALIDRYSSIAVNPSDLILLGPLINQLLEISVKNDDHLVKLAVIVQRILTNVGKDESGFVLSEGDKEKLLASVSEYKETLAAPMTKQLPSGTEN
jgi:hypothetical protein